MRVRAKDSGPRLEDGSRFIREFNKRVRDDISDESWWAKFNLRLMALKQEVGDFNGALEAIDFYEVCEESWLVAALCERLQYLAKQGAEWEEIDFMRFFTCETLLITFLDWCDWDLQDPSNHPRIVLGLEDA